MTFSSISGSYTTLKIFISGRDTATGSSALAIRLKINSDATAANYQASQYIYGNGGSATATTVAANTSGTDVCEIPGSSGNANSLGAAEVTIINYAQTTFYKPIISNFLESYTSFISGNISTMWKSTAAITDLVFTAGGTAFVNGSIFTLYGLT